MYVNTFRHTHDYLSRKSIKDLKWLSLTVAVALFAHIIDMELACFVFVNSRELLFETAKP